MRERDFLLIYSGVGLAYFGVRVCRHLGNSVTPVRAVPVGKVEWTRHGLKLVGPAWGIFQSHIVPSARLTRARRACPPDTRRGSKN